jgi:hypothetical protein
MKRQILLLVLLAACSVAPPPPPASTPPPPDRPENAAVATGVIRDAGGRAVARAAIRAWAADPACNVIGPPSEVVSGENGTYEVRVGRDVGPQFDACIVLEARAGGVTARVQQPVHYAPNPPSVPIDITLLPAALLTREEASRLIDLVQRAMRNEHEAVQELAPYLNLDVSSAYTALAPIAQRIRRPESVTLVEERDRHYVYEMRGARGAARVTIAQDAITKITLE